MRKIRLQGIYEEKEAKENSTYLEYGMKVQIDFIFGVEQID